MRQKTDAPLNAFIETAEFFIAKLRRYTTGVDVEEMQWTPAGIANSLSWIVLHCADSTAPTWCGSVTVVCLRNAFPPTLGLGHRVGLGQGRDVR
jgi:hypothetical protein